MSTPKEKPKEDITCEEDFLEKIKLEDPEAQNYYLVQSQQRYHLGSRRRRAPRVRCHHYYSGIT